MDEIDPDLEIAEVSNTTNHEQNHLPVDQNQTQEAVSSFNNVESIRRDSQLSPSGR